MSDTSTLVWLDLESTCSNMNEAHACVLEIAAFTTDMNLKPLGASFMRVINPGLSVKRTFINEYDLPDEHSVSEAIDLVWRRMDPFVQNMHMENGLWDEAVHSGVSMSLADKEFGDWLYLVGGGKKVAIAGSGVSHFDLPWIKRFFPISAGYFEYYTYDVGNIRRFFRDILGIPVSFADPAGTSGGDEKVHRAMNDAVAHCDEARAYVKFMKERL